MKDHALFPATDAGPIDVVKINVSRWEGGTQKYAAESFAADELPDLSAVWDRFGGGRFELIGRGPKGAIAARVTYTLDGAPRPLNGPEPAAPAPVAPHAPPPGNDSGNAALLLGMIQLMGQQNQSTMALIAQLLQSKGQDAQSHVQVMQAAYAQQTAQMAELFRAVATTKGGGGGDSIEKILDAIQVGVDLVKGGQEARDEGKPETDPITATVEGATQAVTLLERFQALGNKAPPRASSPKPAPAPDPEPMPEEPAA